MSLESIWDAIARQAAEVPGVKAAYATRTGGQGATVRLYPEDITDGPVAVVDYTGTTVETIGLERLVHSFEVVLWMPVGNATRGSAVAALAPMFERFLVAFRANAGLYGTAFTALVTGSSGFDDDSLPDIPDKTYLTQAIAIRAEEVRVTSTAIGPSS